MDQYLERIASALEKIANVFSVPSYAGLSVTVPGEQLPVAETKKARKLKEPTPAPATEVPFDVPQVDPVPAAEVKKSGKPVTLSEIAEAVRKVVASDKENGHKNATSILKAFGASRISEVKEADFVTLLPKLQELLKAK